MTKEFKLPELAEGVESAEVTNILVEVGDEIEQEQAVIELETGKATAEVPSSFAGVVKEIKVSEGDEINIGQVILTFDEEGEAETEKSEKPTGKKQGKGEGKDKPKEKKAEKPAKETPETPEKETAQEDADAQEPEQEAEPEEQQEQQEQEKEQEASPTKQKELAAVPGSSVPAAPSVRKFAREIGVNLANVKGSGDNGRVFIDDVKDYARQRLEGMAKGEDKRGAAKPSTPALPDFSRWGSVRRERRRMVARETARHMAMCWSEIPHVTQHDVADVTELEDLRHRYAARAEKAGGKLTITPILVKIVASALKVFPKFNTSLDLDSDELIYKEYYHLGVAVDTERGLLVPVLRDLDKKNMIEISAELVEVAEKTRRGKVDAEDLTGGTFTITNLGGIGGTHFTPIVNWPQVAILGVGRAQRQPACHSDVCEPRLILPLSLSYDHRVIDGADGARFLRWIVEAIEEPLLLSLEG